MTAGIIVSNSSPLIGLNDISRLDLLEQIFGTVLVPPAVVQETSPTVTLPAWIGVRQPVQPIGPQVLSASLGPGESEAISLALEMEADWLILDERPARRLAQALGLKVIGTLGILLAAKRRGLLPAVQPCLDALVQHGFRISADLYEQILKDAGETP